ncbi:baseplate assembly protein [Plesiomonas shigelloides]|uniref:baseplate assembly protein n=1 Tax=Plesiomonas shigelloides TaxID=703 RepID=UPI00126287E9|nr:baseplate assembly protein [Plesiomonas shigelloides]KAB7666338.1 baseplate assembly protein [Plesiomonas shigelloides]
MASVDLSQLPMPNVVEELDFEVLLAERKERLLSLCHPDDKDAMRRALQMESEPMVKLLQENAYRELLLRKRINEAAQAVMVAYARSSDLEQLAANNNVSRLVVTPEDTSTVPPIPAVMEDDADLRVRIPAAFEGLSVAGPTAAYEFHALSADGQVADASAISPAPAQVTVTVLSRTGNGQADEALLTKVRDALNDENVRPVSDRLTVQSASIVSYRTIAQLYVYPGPEAEPILAAAKARLQTYISAQRRLGRDIRLSAIYAALHVEGVQRVVISEPAKDIVLNRTQAAYCTEWVVTVGGTDE